jgi:outer membrane protein assembly factor BamC
MLSACSWFSATEPEDNLQGYEKVSESPKIKIPNGYSNKRISERMTIPKLTPTSAKSLTGDALDITPPVQILSVAENMRTNRTSDLPSVFIVIKKSDLEEKLSSFFDYIGISYKKQAGNFKTDWVVTDNEAWWRTVFGTEVPRFIRSKFQIELRDGERIGEQSLTVKQVKYQEMPYDQDRWNDLDVSAKSAASFLNEIVGYFDYLDRLESAKLLAKLSRGVTVELGKDVNNNAALVAETNWQTMWLKTPGVLKPFGFTLSDKDIDAGSYFFEFEPNEPGFFASLVGSDSSVAFPLEKGAYKVIIGGKRDKPVTLSIYDDVGNSISDAKMVQIFPNLSEAFGRRTKTAKKKR